jgi:hypothetical protein
MMQVEIVADLFKIVLQLQETTASFSRAQHPRNSGIHFFFLKKLSARDLIEGQLDLLIEARFLFEQAVDSFHHQVGRAAASPRG